MTCDMRSRSPDAGSGGRRADGRRVVAGVSPPSSGSRAAGPPRRWARPSSRLRSARPTATATPGARTGAAAGRHGGRRPTTPSASGLAPRTATSSAPTSTTLPRGVATRARASACSAPDGRAVTDFDVEHERRMHLIVVRRDLTGYQHLHPTLGADGRWRVSLRLPEARRLPRLRRLQHRRAAHDPRHGPLRRRRLPPGARSPPPSAVDTTGRLPRRAVRHRPSPRARSATLEYALSRGGRPLAGVEPYLGADGHLVALREGDLAFLHVHPEESDTPGTIRFARRPAVAPGATACSCSSSTTAA